MAKGVIVDASTRNRAQLRVLTELEGGWFLEELIGLGGSAAVYRGRRRADGCVGAVKVMHSHLSLDASWLRRFEREVALLQENPCVGLVRVLEVGPSSGTPFFVMELLHGQSLEAARVASGGTLPAAEALAHAESVLEVLALLHGVGVVHRDLKPSNLFLTVQGEIKVLDFGIASASASSNDSSPGLGHTTTTGILGTPAFMPPEQARGRWDLVDGRSDLWALGATLFTLLSGETVHLAGTENERLGLAMSKQPRSLRLPRPQLQSRIIRLVDRALAYEARDRFQSADEFKRSLRDALAGFELFPEPSAHVTVRESSGVTLAVTRKRRSSAVGAAGVIAVLGLLGGAALWDGGPTVGATAQAPEPPRVREEERVATESRTATAAAPSAPAEAAAPGASAQASVARAVEHFTSRAVQTAAANETEEPVRQMLDERVILRVEATGSELLDRRE